MTRIETIGNGMTSGLSSPSRPWKKLSTYDDALMDEPEVRFRAEDQFSISGAVI